MTRKIGSDESLYDYRERPISADVSGTLSKLLSRNLQQQKPPRVNRPIAEKLEAFDDHLFLLRDALHNLRRDDARLKVLASELRLLICKSSGTEGLLWRLTREMNVDDRVHVHVPGTVDLKNPLAKGLQFLFMPLLRAGKGHPSMPVGHLNFRGLVKQSPAIFADGQHITHEKIISLVANQIGSSHEADTVNPQLHFLRNVFINNRPPFFDILARDAEFTLEIGERVITKAETTFSFKRKSRAHEGYGDLSITIRLRLKHFVKEPIHVATFESAVSNINVQIIITATEVRYQVTKSGASVGAVEAPVPTGWTPDTSAVFCMSYSSTHQRARAIVNGVAMPEVRLSLGFVDIREMVLMPTPDSPVLSKELIAGHERLLRPDEIRTLAEGTPPYFGGILKPGDAEDPVFPDSLS
jgi:hypothetical protein